MPGIKKITENKKTALIVLLSLAVLFLFGGVVLAQETNVAGLTTGFAARAGFGTTDIRVTIASIIRIILGFLGIVAVLIIMYGGFIYMTAAGNEEKIAKAKRILRDAVIGLLIVLTSFAITQFIIGRLLAGVGLGGGGGVGGPGGSALGAGPIESHYPARNATGIPRNTNIIITFKEKINAATVIKDGTLDLGTADGPTTADDDTIKICQVDQCKDGIYLSGKDVFASVTEDQKTFVFDPKPLLGSADQNIWYKVIVDGLIKKATGSNLFPGTTPGTYDWQFEVSTLVDVTPPRVVSVIPRPASENPRNTIIQINFNEGVNPITASGETATFDKITVKYGNTKILGTFTISNQYRTVEFISDEPCRDKQENIMKNSCGGDVFCLPGGAEFTVKILAASVGEAPSASELNGVVDLANNSLDGNRDGQATGPLSEYDFGKPGDEANKAYGDNLIWHFKTNDTIDLTPPEIISVSPEVGAGIPPAIDSVSPRQSIRILFSKLIMSSTLKPDSNYPYTGSGKNGICRKTTTPCEKDADCLTTAEKTCDEPFEYVTLVQPEPPSPLPAGYANADAWKNKNWVGYWLSKEDNDTESTGVMKHGQFVEFSDYTARVGSGVKDIHQNCFFPSPGPGCIAPAGTLASPNCEAVAP